MYSKQGNTLKLFNVDLDWVNFNNKYNLIKSSSGYDLCMAYERRVQPVHGSEA
jgi:hypothetical protein